MYTLDADLVVMEHLPLDPSSELRVQFSTDERY
jgi:hypothetical protein